MAGHMGHETTTMQKIEVVKVDEATNILYLLGSVPGPRGGFVKVSETVKNKKFRKEQAKVAVKKDKMGNIIGKTPTKAAKK
jgi:hypothetical protein